MVPIWLNVRPYSGRKCGYSLFALSLITPLGVQMSFSDSMLAAAGKRRVGELLRPFQLFAGRLVHLVWWLTHWGRETHTCVGKLTIIASDNGLSPGRRKAIIWTNDGILLIGSLGTNFNEILIEIHTFSFKKMHLKMSSAKWRPFCLGLNVLSRHKLKNVTAVGLLQANISPMWYEWENTMYMMWVFLTTACEFGYGTVQYHMILHKV